jgi:hypothetical protein
VAQVVLRYQWSSKVFSSVRRFLSSSVKSGEDTELENLYENGENFKANEDKIIEFLKALGTETVKSDYMRHTRIIRGITANPVLMRRYMEATGKRNTFYTVMVIILASIPTITRAIQAIYCFTHC